MKVLKKDFAFFVLFLSLSFLTLFLDSRRFLESPKVLIFNLTLPISNSLYVWKGLGFTQYLPFLKEKQKEIDILYQENIFLVSQLSQDKKLEEENTQMRRLLGTNLPPSWKFLPGEVIFRQGDLLTVSFEDEAEEDELVVLPKLDNLEESARLIGLYVGKIKGRGKLVRVELPTNPSSKVEVVVRSKDNFERQAWGILEGRGGSLILTQVLSSENLGVGDWVLVNAGQDARSELLVGKIIKESFSSNVAFKSAEVESVLDKDKLVGVFAVKR